MSDSSEHPEGQFSSWLHFLDSCKDPERAGAMKKYMRNQFEFLGIKNPVRTALLKEHIQREGIPPMDSLPLLVQHLWKSPYREYHYCAMELLDKQKKKLSPGHLELLEFLIVTNPWWDTVDLIASKLVGHLFLKFPELIPGKNKEWMESGHLWLQRTCLLFQLGYKSQTDLLLLQSNIMALSGHKDFFIRKAIGWILRQYSRTNSEWVIGFVNQHELSPLSKKEALKWLTNRKGA